MRSFGAKESKHMTERTKMKMSYIVCAIIMANKQHVENHCGEMIHISHEE